MQTFNEFINTKNLVEAILESGADVNVICDGIHGLAQRGKLTECIIMEAWGIPQMSRAASGVLGGLASAGRDALGWLGKKAMQTTRTVGSYAKDRYQTAAAAEAQRQVQTRINAL